MFEIFKAERDYVSDLETVEEVCVSCPHVGVQKTFLQ